MKNRLIDLLSKDGEQLEEFHRVVIGDYKTVGDYHWEYCGLNPDRSLFSVALDDLNRIAATQGIVPADLSFSGEVIPAGKSESSFARGDCRGTSVFRDLYNFFLDKSAEKGYEIIWGVTSATKVMRKLGFEVHSSLKETSVPLYEPWFDEGDGRWLSPLRRALWGRKNIVRLAISISTLLKSCPQYEVRFNRLSSSSHQGSSTKQVSLRFHNDYLKWRLQDNPHFENWFSVTLTDRNDTELKGVAYVNIDDDVAYLSHVEATCTTLLDALIGRTLQLCAIFRAKRVLFMGNISNNQVRSSFQALRKWGAMKEWDFPLKFVVKPLDPSRDALCQEFNQWAVQGIWLQGVRY